MRVDKKRVIIYIIFTSIILSSLFFLFPSSVEAQGACSLGCALGQICRSNICTDICNDGTPVGTCSFRKPLFCNPDQRLINNIAQCGCPIGKVPLPSGYCGIRINETSFLSEHFEAGRVENLDILPLRAGLPNLASDASINVVGFICPNPGVRLTSPPNPSDLNNVVIDFTSYYGVNGEKILNDFMSAPIRLDKWLISSPGNILDGREFIYPRQSEVCYIPNNVTSPYIQLDLGSIKSFSEVTLSLSYPFITDYQILYSRDNTNWNVAYTGHDELSLKNTYTDYWSFGTYGSNDLGYTKVHRDLKTRGAISFQTEIGGINYQTHQFSHSFNPVSGRYVRFVPKNWFERAGVYEIEIRNPDSQLQLKTKWDNAIQKTRYLPNGSYESPVLFANVSPADLSYQKISWNLGSNQFADKNILRNAGLDVPEYGFIQFDTGNVNDFYTSTRLSNDLSDRSYGYPGNAGNGNIGGSPNAGAVPLTLANRPNDIWGGSIANNAQLTNQGIGNSALSLDGVDDYAFATADPLLRLEDNFTISAWVKPENGGPVLSKGTGNGVTTDYSFAVTTFGMQGQIGFFVRGQLYQTPADLSIDSNWHHVIVTYEKPGTLKFYLDNALVYTDNTVNGNYAAVPYNNPYSEYYSETLTWEDSFLVGAHGRSGVTPFKGKIDEIMIYDRSLSLSEIQQIRSLQVPKLNVAGAVGNLPDNLNKLLLAYWDFSGSVIPSTYKPYQYWTSYTTSRWNNGNKIPNRVAPQYSQILSGSYPEAGHANVAYGGPKCAFDDKWAGQLTSSGGVPNLPCVYHPAEAAFQKPGYEGTVSWALDTSSHRLDLGVAFGANTTSDSVKGRALILDGVDDYLSRPFPPLFLTQSGEVNHLNIGTGDFSGSVWIKDPSVQWSGVFSKGRGNPGFDGLLSGAYDLFVSRNGDSAGVAFRIIDANRNVRIVETSYSGASQWHHISFTLNRASQEMKIYVDGNLASTYTGGISTASMVNNYPFVIGAQQFMQEDLPMHTNYAGKIDELRLYGRMLSVSEIQQLANERTSPVQAGTDIGLKGFWKFDESDYVYFPKDISVAHGIRFVLPAGSSFDRVAISELQDRISYIDLRGIITLAKEPTGNYNTVTVFDLPQRQTAEAGGEWYTILLYTRVVPGLHERTPLVWEIGLLETANAGSLPPVNFGDLHAKFQFRSGDSESAVLSAPWTGSDGTSATFYDSSGQAINSIHNGNSYYQYRFIASTEDNRYTPVVDNVTVTYAGKINLAPRAYIKNPGKIFTFENTEFDASLSRDDAFIERYDWDFGDGTVASGGNEVKRTNHQYSSPGEYTVHLTVYDSAGFSGETYLTVNVDPFDCMTPDTVGNADTEIFGAISGSNVEEMVGNALIEYAEKHDMVSIASIDTSEEYMDAALEYLEEHMSYLTPRRQCFETHGGLPRWPVSLDRITDVTPQCGCPEGADFCGNCQDFSIAYTTLVRAMGVNSKCVYSAITESILPFQTKGTHAYNVILYKGKYRMVEPQGNSLTSKFRINSLEWSNGELPYYLTGSISNDQIGRQEDGALPITTRQTILASKIKNYPGSTGLPDSGRRCVPAGYLNLSTETQRLNFVAQQMYLLTYVYNSAEYEAAPDKCTYSVNFNLRKILGRAPTTSEIGRFETCTSTGNGIKWNEYNRYMSEIDFKNTFKQSFTLFATGANGDFMAINENIFLEKLYAYLMGFPITDTVNQNKEDLARGWHRDTKYSFYRSFYSGYDPLEVFEDVCP
ncbi:MAG: LamG-like jellyroll fold domain-containing protein [Nanoarchaeota archaeon]